LDRALRRRWTPDRVGEHADRLAASIPIACPVPADVSRLVNRADLAFREPIERTARDVASTVRDAIAGGSLALTLGGDHALAFGTVAGASWATERVGVVWLDTHPDLNTPAGSPSGHIHGMPLGTVIGLEGRVLSELEVPLGRSPLVDPADVVMLGIRDIDPPERDAILRHGIWAMSMEEWHDTGIGRGLDRALAHLTARGV